MMQICLSLRLADEKFGFRHGDLEPRNTMIVPLDAPINITYKLRSGNVVINTQHILIILDFGVSSINPCVLGDVENYVATDLVSRKKNHAGRTVVQDLAGFINYIANPVHIKVTVPRRELKQTFASYLGTKLREGNLICTGQNEWGTAAEVYTKLETLHGTIVPLEHLGGSVKTNKRDILLRYAILKQNYLDAKHFYNQF